MKDTAHLISGFDLVCEEDYTPDLDHWLPLLYGAKVRAKELGVEFPLYLHCGETNSRNHTQLYDVILLGTKRIGHGFKLAYHPELIE